MNTIEMIKNLARRNSVVASGDVAALIEEFDAVSEKLAEVVAERDAALNTERIWETTMMEVCGEDGPASVAAVIKALAAENAALGRALSLISGNYGLSPHIQSMCVVDTPATDAAVREIQARGVEKFVERLRVAAKLANDDGKFRAAHGLAFDAVRAEKFAAELREGK